MPARTQPPPPGDVAVYVYQPLGYIPGVPVGQTVTVDLIIEVSGIVDDSPEGISGWDMDVAVDPAVLGVYDPPVCEGAKAGYFLYEFAWVYGHDSPVLSAGWADPDAGYWGGLTENILPPPGGGAGEGFSGLQLVTLKFESRSQTEYSAIELIDVGYVDGYGVRHDVDDVTGGHYNSPQVPEFPLGEALEILFIPVIIYTLWRSGDRKKAFR